MRRVLREASLLVAAGLAIGIPAAIIVSRVFRDLVLGVTTTDPLSYAATSILLILLSTIATYSSARRASKVDPMTTLRGQ